MIIDNTNIWNSPRRTISAKVELYDGSTLASTFQSSGAIKGFTIERAGETGKFFGFGIPQKFKLELLDKNREIEEFPLTNHFKVFISSGGDYLDSFPEFYVKSFKRDENTNGITVEAEDSLFAAAGRTVAELNLVAPYTIRGVAQACAANLGLTLLLELPEGDTSFDLEFPMGANFEGTENLRDTLNAIAEATQTIYFIKSNSRLTFKRLSNDSAINLTIGKDVYTKLKTEPGVSLTSIVSTTALGDNVGTGSDDGETQYVRDNPFWDINENIASLVEGALARVRGLSILPFDCAWRGNAALEIGDKVSLIGKDDSEYVSFVLNDTIKYTGGLSAQTFWQAQAAEETHSNPSTLGAALKQTYAKVDKTNKRVEIVVSDVEKNKTNISSLEMETGEISFSVSELEEKANTSIEELEKNITAINKRVDATMTADAVKLEIQTELDKGAHRVVTNTGFTFNEEGLTVAKTDSEMTTQITEDGMTVSKNNKEVLVANNEGVKATNLHAVTYLIVGNNSRFENYQTNRTGCFWIGN